MKSRHTGVSTIDRWLATSMMLIGPKHLLTTCKRVENWHRISTGE
jgi:hypothetical protein